MLVVSYKTWSQVSSSPS